jgi:hypothetical protein
MKRVFGWGMPAVAAGLLVVGCDRNSSQGGTSSDAYQGTGRNAPDKGDVGGNGNNYDRGGEPTHDLRKKSSAGNPVTVETNMDQKKPGETGAAR